MHEAFRRLRPGTTVLALHSKMKYTKRIAMYDSFVRKQRAVLFATDIVARGLGTHTFVGALFNLSTKFSVVR